MDNVLSIIQGIQENDENTRCVPKVSEEFMDKIFHDDGLRKGRPLNLHI